ncbi:uridine kinase [Sporosarcina sp. 179-K 3D1 HS]|uniref:uridine kinase n=1 Tax=Sporosarcina sp. 179-K 3D1 HS TaxID=3232169 RepID=UPI0039A1E202
MRHLLPAFRADRTVLIGIDGLGGSGKSTAALELQQQIEGSVVLHLDDFIFPKAIRYQDGFEEWYCYYYLQWRYDYLVEHVLAPLKQGLSVKQDIEFYNKVTDRYDVRELHIPARTPAVIVEGVFLQREELRDFFNTIVFLEVDRETRTERVIKRDYYIGNSDEILKKYERRYFPAEEHYLKLHDPTASADVVIRD